jgi:hypothetical protein
MHLQTNALHPIKIYNDSLLLIEVKKAKSDHSSFQVTPGSGTVLQQVYKKAGGWVSFFLS